ncbi:DHHA1 domain-containing protein [Candidatus Bathyarchaeota archaeon]|jgi:RecJ-like exonuclease|nr:DHHA1 domain-containing protein [Candidatus Bathyarchaeota archaeon]
MSLLLAQKGRVNIPRGSKVFCISHKDDPDGLASAALARCATHCSFSLTGYEDLERVLADAPRNLDCLILADLGLNEKREVISGLPAIAEHVLYVDHHLLSAESKRALRKAKVIVRHSLSECASVLVWDALREMLPDQAINIAAYGAVTDPPVSGRLTRQVILETSWNLDAYEGHLLALALSSRKCTDTLRKRIVRGLAALQLPHEMSAVSRLADQQAVGMLRIQKQLYDRAEVRGRVAIARAGHLALGTTAELLLGVPNVVSSLVYQTTRRARHARISVRGTDECGQHLGKLMLRLSRKVGGEGGGHMLAAGAMVPSSRMREFLSLFVKAVGH